MAAGLRFVDTAWLVRRVATAVRFAGGIHAGARHVPFSCSLVAAELPAECCDRRGVIFQSPVLMIDPAVLGLVEPDQPEQMVATNPGEQARDDASLPSDLSGGCLGEQQWFPGEFSYRVDGGPENSGKGVLPIIVISVNSCPVNICRAGPVVPQRAGARVAFVNRPYRGDVVGFLLPEYGHDMPPCRHPGGRG